MKKSEKIKNYVINYVALKGGKVLSAREIINHCWIRAGIGRRDYHIVREVIAELVKEGVLNIDNGYYELNKR